LPLPSKQQDWPVSQAAADRGDARRAILADNAGGWIERRYANPRGLVRLALANSALRLGLLNRFGRVDWSRVKRLVFVCQGNICRSPIAHAMAAKLIDRYPVASIGLATTTGAPAFGTARDVAQQFSVDLTSHRATDISDFDILDGDLFLVMEYRHVTALARHLLEKDVQVALLGLWCRPPYALIYDPHKQSRVYFVTCFKRIHRAIEALAAEIHEGAL
jgi:protein-tyrosine phosphatase